MKRIIILSIVCLLTTLVKAQTNPSCIFLSADSFNVKSAIFRDIYIKVKPHYFFNSDIIEVKAKDTTYKFNKNSVYGYMDDDSNYYRFYENKVYPILNPNETILLYKIADMQNQRYSNTTYIYLFSKNSGSAILPLTQSYLLREFKDNTEFIKMLLGNSFENNNYLEYDYFSNSYKLNTLLKLTQKK